MYSLKRLRISDNLIEKVLFSCLLFDFLAKIIISMYRILLIVFFICNRLRKGITSIFVLYFYSVVVVE